MSFQKEEAVSSSPLLVEEGSGGGEEKEPKKDTPKFAGSGSQEKDVRELIEKNLKWSQIIYEQNRKINSKLFWSSFASWLRLLIILIPLILGIIYLPPLLKQVISQYQSLFGVSKTSTPSLDLDNLFKLFDVDSAKQEQFKAIIK